MELEEMLAALEEKDTARAYAVLKELEALSERSDILCPYAGHFAEMACDSRYVMRVRGFRLLCRQCRWEQCEDFPRLLESAMGILQDEKPTAVRQALAALTEVAQLRPELREMIRRFVLQMDCRGYKDSVQGLILKDRERLLEIAR